MIEDRTEFRPFGVESRARHCRIAFLVDPEACPRELLDSLFEANYGVWGGRFNPIVPVRKGEIEETFWSLLRYVDPDFLYTYACLTQTTIDRIQQEIVPWGIEPHPAHLTAPGQTPFFVPMVSEGLVKSREVLPLLMSQQARFAFGVAPTLLTYFHDGRSPLNRELARLVTRNFGIIHERALPALPDEWPRLQVQNNWTACELFQHLATTPSLLFPFQASAAHAATLPRTDAAQEEYSIIVGDSAETWLYFWNRIFLVRDYLRPKWNTLCLSSSLLRDPSFVGPFREFLKRRVQRSGSSPTSLTLQSFDCSEEELAELRGQILNGLDTVPRSKKLRSGEFTTVNDNRFEVYVGWGRGTTQQQGTSRKPLLNAPESQVPIDQGIWVMDLRVQYLPRFAFYGNEVLSWKLPRRIGLAEAFFSGARCRVDADYSLSVEMRRSEPFILSVPTENEIFCRAAGIVETRSYGPDLKASLKKPTFRRLGPWDKGLYLSGILELFGGLEPASHFFEHSYWRGIFESLSLGTPEKEAGVFARVRNKLTKNQQVISSQLRAGHVKPIEWLSHLVVKQAREVQARRKEIFFSELESAFQEQRERFMVDNPNFRAGMSPEEIERDKKSASAQLLNVLQGLTDAGVLQQGMRIRCSNCGSRFWREIETLRQKVQCDGCKVSVSVPVESKWCYRLNSLVRNGIALHGCVPVISALRDLREKARDCFIYTHGVALFKDYDDPAPEAEVDLLCISDGKLVCGEVKSSAVEFTREELAKLARIVTAIKADQAAISAFRDPDDLMPQHSKTLAELLPADCSVVVCGPRQMAFQPMPHAM